MAYAVAVGYPPGATTNPGQGQGPDGRGEPPEAAATMGPNAAQGCLITAVASLVVGHQQPGDGGAAERAGRRLKSQGRRVGLAVAAQRQRARRAHLVPTVLHLDRARLVEADAAQLCVARL